MRRADPPTPLLILAALPLVLGVGALLLRALLHLPPVAEGIGPLVREALPRSGVEAEVTAVLLNFRAYDTLLELAVLLAALVGAWQQGAAPESPAAAPGGPVLAALLRLLLPVVVVTAGYVLWRGGHGAGGAFQAGALLAGAGVLLAVSDHPEAHPPDSWRLRLLLVAGPAVLALAGAVGLGMGGALLEYPAGTAGAWILLIEGVSALSIGMVLLLLFGGGRPPRRSSP